MNTQCFAIWGARFEIFKSFCAQSQTPYYFLWPQLTPLYKWLPDYISNVTSLLSSWLESQNRRVTSTSVLSDPKQNSWFLVPIPLPPLCHWYPTWWHHSAPTHPWFSYFLHTPLNALPHQVLSILLLTSVWILWAFSSASLPLSTSRTWSSLLWTVTINF